MSFTSLKPSYLACFAFFFVIFSLQKYRLFAQNATATLDPSEARALNSIFEKWDAKAVALWNISGEPCSGSAIDGSDFERAENNPAIVCDCSFNSNTTCHITHLSLTKLDKRGEFPEEMTALKHLTFLKIDKNFFSGPLPSFIGNLSALTLLSISTNLFSGTIPKELGNLKDLNLLSIGSNNFSGTLPPEIGNLVKLEQIYMNSCGVGGEIPSTFAKLINMRIMWLSDSPYSGKIPDFIGNWTQLKTLRLQGNSFEGPIPSSFSQLTSLNSLRIGDIYNGSSSTLDFLENLKSLTDLVIRNALVSGSIPTDIGEYTDLQTLDLSFNSLTGELPSSLFRMSSLTSLFLGNNSFFGSLPSQKSDTLQNIDLSYNFLSGTFPSWVTSVSQLNLVANNFTFDKSNVTDFPGLNCLQRNFPCNRITPLYANFSIKCGGGDIRGNDGILYEAENSTLGPASFYMTSTEKWAVSNSGMYNDRKSPSYIQNTLSQVSRTSTPELFQSARISPGSLRYYGLSLENGPYTVTLQFSETGFDDENSQGWKSLGRRVFDVYIQGERKIKDFDVAKEAGGVSRAITRTFSVIVSENYIEVHLFWAGKGTCCVPETGYYGPTITTLRAASDFQPTVSGIPRNIRSKKSKTGLFIGIAVSLGILSLILVSALAFWYKMKKDRGGEEDIILGLASRPDIFSYSELKAATKNFNSSNKLGEGGFGPVFKGNLADGRVIAVKQLSIASSQGKDQFITEIATISAVRHRNLVQLYGCCIEGNRRILVYEYLENKSLDQALFDSNGLYLDWPTRFNICLETAKGLAYLHEETRPRVVHRDVKASNILLDEAMCPKISDFGLAKFYDYNKTHISTRVIGTIGYLAPEYAMRGHLTEKADVFSFGIVTLELLTGRPNSVIGVDDEKSYLLEWVWKLHEENQTLKLVDPTLTDYNKDEAVRLIGVAIQCTQASPANRPQMSRVVAMLAGDAEISSVTSKPSYLTDLDFKEMVGGFTSKELETPSSSSKEITKRASRKDSEINAASQSGIDPLLPSHVFFSETMMITDIIGDGR